MKIFLLSLTSLPAGYSLSHNSSSTDDSIQDVITVPQITGFLEKLIVAQPVKNTLILCNTMAHYRVHNSPPMNPVRIHFSQANTFTAYILRPI
jgi:hypothetical protein